MLIPLVQIQKYKPDDLRNLVKYKLRLYTRSNLQSTIYDTYLATLLLKLFRLIYAIINKFDIETIQIDAINTFLNALLLELVFLQLLEGFGRKRYVLKYTKALYGLKESLNLQNNNFTLTLERLSLEEVAECLQKREQVLVFFFIDDTYITYQKKDRDITKKLR